ncbi:Thiolase, N-terminal domain [Shewanella psychrophila]|uniref:Thiolase, N-terminal domain n=1 Tax=Shewanella psychrophila TaxID=225848 RepID=A0A1S6HVG5_9GAMM|nr:Thiolase, N-terminal domain [Shewanella psychrophila]
MFASGGINFGRLKLAVAGGMESVSNAPYLLAKARRGLVS